MVRPPPPTMAASSFRTAAHFFGTVCTVQNADGSGVLLFWRLKGYTPIVDRVTVLRRTVATIKHFLP